MLKQLIGVLVIVCFISGCMTTRYRANEVYDDRIKPITTTKFVKQIVSPIIDRSYPVIAFINVSGTSKMRAEKINEYITLGFQQEKKNSNKSLLYIPQTALLTKLSQNELTNMGEASSQILINNFGINVICRVTVLKAYELSVESVDLISHKTDTRIFKSDSWKKVGEDIAKAFYGTLVKEVEKKTTVNKKVRVLVKTEQIPYQEVDWNNTLLVSFIAGGLGYIAFEVIRTNFFSSDN